VVLPVSYSALIKEQLMPSETNVKFGSSVFSFIFCGRANIKFYETSIVPCYAGLLSGSNAVDINYELLSFLLQ